MVSLDGTVRPFFQARERAPTLIARWSAGATLTERSARGEPVLLTRKRQARP